MLRANYNVRWILILIVLLSIGCRSERERWRAKMWVPSVTSASIVSAKKELISCSSAEMLQFFCARLEDLTELEVLLESCKRWGTETSAPPLFDFSRPHWRVKTWLPHPNSGSIVSAEGYKISCDEGKILGFFCAELKSLHEAEKLLNQCEAW